MQHLSWLLILSYAVLHSAHIADECAQMRNVADALAAVRRQVWGAAGSCSSPAPTDVQKLQHSILEHLIETLRYAA